MANTSPALQEAKELEWDTVRVRELFQLTVTLIWHPLKTVTFLLCIINVCYCFSYTSTLGI